jgi:glutamate-1-semialdehyde 2,1-aminomutase
MRAATIELDGHEAPVGSATARGQGAEPVQSFATSRRLGARAHELIPGGSHTYAKGDDQYPELAPGFIVRGRGCHVWDADGNEFIEYGMGNRAVGLGHAYPAVLDAVMRELPNGCNFTRPSPLEIACAEELLGMIEGAEMVKFCKDGSTANTEALRLSRAYTGRDLVAFCADHPFFATHDWFIGSTPMDAGIPQASKDLVRTFRYNDVASVRALFEQHPGRIAALIMEPAKSVEPRDGFLHEVQRLCRQHGAVFILDEMITGFRWHNGGAQRVYGLVPDLSTFGKALANGFAVSALAGKRDIMRLGGLGHDRARVFLLSTTHGAETHALAAAIANMRVYRSEPVIEHIYRQGERLRRGFGAAIKRRGLERHVSVDGRACCLVYGTRDRDGQPSQAFRSLFLQETIRRGVLAPSLVVGYTHRDEDIDRTIEAIDGALEVYARALEDGVARHLAGQASKIVFRRFA